MESEKPEVFSNTVTGKPESVSHPALKKVAAGSHCNLEDPRKSTASDSSQACSDQLESKNPEPISRPMTGKPQSLSHPVTEEAEADSRRNLEEPGNSAASDSPPSISNRVESKKRDPVPGKPEYVSHPVSKKAKLVSHRNSEEAEKANASDSSPDSSSHMESKKPEPISHLMTGKSEMPKKVETAYLEEPGKDIGSDYFPATTKENTSNSKDTANGGSVSVGVADKQASPPRSSISSDLLSYLTRGSPPREENAYMSLPAPVEKDLEQEVVEKRSVEQDSLALVKIDEGGGDVDGGGKSRGSENRRRLQQRMSTLRRSQREKMVKKAALGLRVFGFMLCLVSLSVMVADQKQGWAIDSFQLYKEFRYSMSVNAIGFVYSGAQAIDLIYNSATGKSVFQHPFRYFFDFAIDQVITYLLISASSSAATRVDDWRSNWGKDRFPDMASASVTVSFLSFIAFAFSSLLSGYALCTSGSIHT